MAEVTVRELRNHGGRVLERVMAGETLTVTRDGHPVAELRPLQRRPLDAKTLIESSRGLPPMDLESLRRDLDSIVDPSL